jgi:hypothetical protein
VRRRLVGTNVAVQSRFGLGYRLAPTTATAVTTSAPPELECHGPPSS